MNTSDAAIINSPVPDSSVPRRASFSGTGFPNATVEVWQQNGSLLGQAVVGPNSRWKVTFTSDLPLGPYAVSVHQLLDSVTSEWRNFSFTVADIPSMQTSDVAIINSPAPGTNLPRQKPAVSGTGFPGATVEIWQQGGGRFLGQGLVAQDNRWNVTFTGDLPLGPYTVSVRQIFGDTTSEWRNFSFTVADIPNMQTSDVAIIDTPAYNTYLPRQNAYLSGVGFPGAQVEVWRQNGSLLAQGRVNQNNRWKVILADDLPIGPITFSVRQVLAGLISEWRNLSFLVVESTFPITAVPRIIAPNGTVSSPFRICGKATPGATVAVYRAGTGLHFGDSTANDQGDWSIDNVIASPDTYLITARQQKNSEWTQWSPNQTFVIIAADGWFQFDGLVDPTAELLRIGKRLTDSDRQPTGLYLPANTALTLDLAFINRIDTAQATLFVAARDSNPDLRFKDPREYPLNDGRNLVTDPGGGMLYIKLTGTGNRIKINFISGAVRAPTFIHGQTTPAEYRQQLNTHTQSPQVELRAERVIVTVPRESALLHQDADQDQLMETYTRILTIQDSTLGLDGSTALHAPPTLSRHLILGDYSKLGSAYAWHGPTIFQLDLFDRALLRSDDLKRAWGVAHELGHQHQMLCYKAEVFNESSNNIPALAQERAFGLRSRLLILDNEDTWKKALEKVTRPGLNYAVDLGGKEQLCLFEQLRLAFGEDFWPRLNKHARENTTSNGSSPADPQALDNLALFASIVANADLRSFFAAWGVPVTANGQQSIARLGLPPAPTGLIYQREL